MRITSDDIEIDHNQLIDYRHGRSCLINYQLASRLLTFNSDRISNRAETRQVILIEGGIQGQLTDFSRWSISYKLIMKRNQQSWIRWTSGSEFYGVVGFTKAKRRQSDVFETGRNIWKWRNLIPDAMDQLIDHCTIKAAITAICLLRPDTAHWIDFIAINGSCSEKSE